MYSPRDPVALTDFFFFQAEDGIRDLTVTGVQTCALPILELATQIISDSAFGCAGQRCLAVSVAVTIGEAQKTFRDCIAHAASSIRVGNGLDAGVQMGPVITRESKQRIESLISAGVGEGAKPILDGRNTKIPKYESGNFLTPKVQIGRA